MAIVKYPHAVKVGGVFYAAHAEISVSDVMEHLRDGAVLVEEENASDKPKTAENEETKTNRKGRKPKAE